MSVRGFAVESIEGAGDADAVLDFEVTGNRPDCMSVVGMAREVATAYDLPLRVGAIGAAAVGALGATGAANSDITISIDTPDLCPRYVGAVADVTIGPSPGWMQARLIAGGVR